jgi:hypothetical protein
MLPTGKSQWKFELEVIGNADLTAVAKAHPELTLRRREGSTQIFWKSPTASPDLVVKMNNLSILMLHNIVRTLLNEGLYSKLRGKVFFEFATHHKAGVRSLDPQMIKLVSGVGLQLIVLYSIRPESSVS